MKKKILALALVVCLAATAVIGGTLAYFTDTTQVVTNTFTSGNVTIKLDETEIDEDGMTALETRTEKGNEYKLFPGHTYTKDPKVTVQPGSEDCYVGMKVTLTKYQNLLDLYGENFLPEMLVDGWDPAAWISTKTITQNGDGSATIAFYYKDMVNEKSDIPALFESFKVPDEFSEEQTAKLAKVQIKVVAVAIQAEGFDTAAEAWVEMDKIPTTAA